MKKIKPSPLGIWKHLWLMFTTFLQCYPILTLIAWTSLSWSFSYKLNNNCTWIKCTKTEKFVETSILQLCINYYPRGSKNTSSHFMWQKLDIPWLTCRLNLFINWPVKMSEVHNISTAFTGNNSVTLHRLNFFSWLLIDWLIDVFSCLTTYKFFNNREEKISDLEIVPLIQPNCTTSVKFWSIHLEMFWIWALPHDQKNADHNY